MLKISDEVIAVPFKAPGVLLFPVVGVSDEKQY